jgi:bifunctional non-homologous end joining protein LigD
MPIKKSVSLYYKEGSSDKEYHIQLVEVQGGNLVNFQYGRRGGTLNSGTKTLVPVSIVAAEQVYNKLLKEKTGKGYATGEVKASFSETATAESTGAEEEEGGMLPQLLNDIEDPQTYINDPRYLAQEKKDGERRPVKSNGQIVGFNKKGKRVELPDTIVKSIKGLCELDGEIIGDKLYVFDILSKEGNDLRGYSCEQRIAYLNATKFGKGVEIVTTAYTREDKQALFNKLKLENREGIVFKLKDAPYTVGRPNSGGSQLKFKFYAEATFIVVDSTEGKRSVGLELVEGSKRVFVGKVTIPPNKEVPRKGELVEVRYLYAYRGGAIFQSTYKGTRPDSDLTDATTKQLKFKAEVAV